MVAMKFASRILKCLVELVFGWSKDGCSELTFLAIEVRKSLSFTEVEFVASLMAYESLLELN